MAGSAIPRVTPKRGEILTRLEGRSTQKLLAKHLGKDPALLSKELLGTRPMDLVTAVRIADFLGCDWTAIVKEECPSCGVNVGPKRQVAA